MKAESTRDYWQSLKDNASPLGADYELAVQMLDALDNAVPNLSPLGKVLLGMTDVDGIER